MMRPKEYLVSIGALPKGSERARGRISKANDILCQEGAAKGIAILGYTSTAATDTREASVVKTVVSTEKNLSEAFIRYHDGESYHYVAVDSEGREYSMREACRNCGYSLLGHTCDHPVVVSVVNGKVGSMPVTVERKYL